MQTRSLEDACSSYAQHSRAPGTRASYLQKMVPFRAFCAERGVKAVPADPETVRLYLAKLAESGLSVLAGVPMTIIVDDDVEGVAALLRCEDRNYPLGFAEAS